MRPQRKRWSNLPTGAVPRAGISLKEMTPPQSSAVMALLSSALSARGLEKVQQIMEGDEVNKNSEGNGRPFGGRGRGGPPDRGGDGPSPVRQRARRVTVRCSAKIFTTSRSSERRLRTSRGCCSSAGHHLALNITIAGDRGILTPTLTGAQPALYTENGKTIRPLGPESDKAIALLNALDENQRKQAILSYRVADLVLGPGQDGKTIQPEGLKASNMNDKQRAMLLDVISQWAGIIHESAAAARMAQLKADINETWFAWSGPTTVTPGRNITAYYRIQGPHLVIEYAPQELGGDPSLHVHTMYRDPTNDYGRKGASQ